MALLQDLKNRLNQSKQVFTKIAKAAYQNPTLQKVAGFGEKTSNAVFKPYTDIAKGVKDYTQSTARTFVGAGLALKDKEEYTPKSFASKALLGNKPVARFEKQVTEQAGQFEKLGLGKGAAVPLAFGIGALDIVSPLPFDPGDFAKAGLKNLAKEDIELLVKSLGDDAVKKLAKGKASKELIEQAKTLVKENRSVATGMVKDATGPLTPLEMAEYQKASIGELNEAVSSIAGKPDPGLPRLNPKPQSLIDRERKIAELAEAEKNIDLFTQDKNSPIYDINKERLSVSTGAKETIEQAKQTLKPELETLYGRPVSDDEIIAAARGQNVLKKVVTRDEVVEEAAAELRTRQNLASLSEQVNAMASGGSDPVKLSELMQELKENFKVVKSLNRRKGVLLESNRIAAGDIPENVKVVDEILKKIDVTDKQLDEIIDGASKVDEHNVGQIADFFRKYVEPSKNEILNEYRYINMLSNPKTHIVNAFTNMLQVGTRTFDKLASGVVDKIGSAFTGKAREAYVSEVPEYVKGALNSIAPAWKEAMRVFKSGVVERPDLVRIPTGKIPRALTSVSRALEASDAFFRKILSSGEYESLLYREMKKTGKTDLAPDTLRLLRKQADDEATKGVFRQELGDKNQGYLFKGIDAVAEAIKGLGEKIPPVRWVVPFVDTPTNILKQGLERTPGLGTLALVGAKNKQELIVKQLVGSTLFAGTMYMALQDRTTWKVPSGKKQSAEFYASGKQPYAIKVGDNWYSYSRIGPLAYPMAFAAALKDTFVDEQEKLKAQGKDPRKLNENVGRAMLKMTAFFGDQSYMENIGNLQDAVLEENVNKFNRIIANFGAQGVPLQGFQSFIAKLVDDTYRNPDSVLDNFKSQLPFLSLTVEPYEDPFGKASKRQNNLLNLLSPVTVTEDKKLAPGRIRKISPKPTPKPKPKPSPKY